MSVALGSGIFVLPANEEAAVDNTLGSLNADGPAVAGLGNLLAIAEHKALLAADCWSPVSAIGESCANRTPGPTARNVTTAAIAHNIDNRNFIFAPLCLAIITHPWQE